MSFTPEYKMYYLIVGAFSPRIKKILKFLSINSRLRVKCLSLTRLRLNGCSGCSQSVFDWTKIHLDLATALYACVGNTVERL